MVLGSKGSLASDTHLGWSQQILKPTQINKHAPPKEEDQLPAPSSHFRCYVSWSSFAEDSNHVLALQSRNLSSLNTYDDKLTQQAQQEAGAWASGKPHQEQSHLNWPARGC